MTLAGHRAAGRRALTAPRLATIAGEATDAPVVLATDLVVRASSGPAQ